MLNRAINFILSSMLVLVGLPAWSQLDTRLQVTPTDLIDLYQGVTSAAVLKPEVLLMMDFSTSTNRMMFHPLFPNNFDDEERFDNNSNYYSIYVKIASSGSGASLTYGVSSVGFGRNGLAASIYASGISYTIGGNYGTSNGVVTNTLIKPDGSEVTVADVKATVANANIYRSNLATPESYVLNWVRCASHVRMSCTYGGVTRNVDFPINWAVLDSTSTGKPLSRVTALNPSDSTNYDVDTTYLGAANGSGYQQLREFGGDTKTAECGSSVDNVRLYRSRYIEWILFGKDASGNYYVPDACQALKAVDPSTITYTGSTAAFSYSTLNTVKRAFGNGLPNRNRNQAIKEAFLKTWFNHQSSVSFAYRTLYDTGTTSNGTPTTPYAFDTNHWGVLSSSDATTWTAITGQTPSSGQGTPLVPAQFDAYCQMTNSSAFAAAEAGLTKAQLDCQQHFLIILTDGSPTVNNPVEGSTSFPYLSTTGSSSVFDGNKTVALNTANLNDAQIYWNNATLAAVAAHGGSRSSGTATDWIKNPATVAYTYSSGSTPSAWAPIWIQKRKYGGTSGTDYTLTTPHPIQTMTVGVSLGGYYTKSDGTTAWPSNQAIDSTALPKPIQKDTNGSKFRLLMSALCGDPATTSLNATTVKPFYRSGADKASDAVYFFDGRDPATLVANLEDAFNDIENMSAVNTTASPVIPFVGMGLGQQIYLTRFIPAQVSSNPVWTGDLEMFSTHQVGDTLQILDATGAVVSDLDSAPPNWSADDAIRNNRLWSSRQVWTRLKGETALRRFTPFDNGTGGAPANAFTTIKTALATALTVDADKQQLIAWNLGADVTNAAYTTPTSPNPSCPNRALPTGQTIPPGDILGDIVNSTPAVVEYTINSWVVSQLGNYPKLQAMLSAASAASATPHFRIIFIGTNRGFMHAFGEVSYTKSTTDPSTGVVSNVAKGAVDELWAFMPTEFLGALDTIGPNAKGKHRYCVDGAPYAWFLDLPVTGSVVGNGKVDYLGPSATGNEKAILVFGLRKGGRAYYGLNIQNPFIPGLAWSLNPDEGNGTADVDAAANGASLTTLVSNMGFSSCMPAVGRVLAGANPKLRDVVFLGGGYSTPEVEAKFSNVALGRSAFALDVQTGAALAWWDFSTLGMGPVASGLVPFEFFLNSGLVQRAYFTDYKGGLWALGSGKTNASGTYVNFRRDSNRLDEWTTDGSRGSALKVRKIYQDTSAKTWRDTTGANNGIHSVRPAPFLIGNYPGLAKWVDGTGNTTTLNPAAVGVALVSGDRDNPLDKSYTTTTMPTKHRLTVVFDRQDSARTGLGLSTGGLITDSNLADFTSQTTAPASNYWDDNSSGTKFGYYMNFPVAAGASDGNTYVPKGIYEPIVLDKVLFFSDFAPSTSSCSGGSGNTYTYRVCDVMFPAWPGNGTDASTAAGCQSGRVASWIGVSSPMGVLSTAAAIQSGIKNFTPPGSGTAVPGIGIQVFEGQLHEKFPKVRVWRTVR